MANRKFRKGQFFIIGIGIGTALGVANENIPVWLAAGAGLGVVMDAFVARRNRSS
jgi:hypothetical protein